jgi:hypothetical protein
MRHGSQEVHRSPRGDGRRGAAGIARSAVGGRRAPIARLVSSVAVGVILLATAAGTPGAARAAGDAPAHFDYLYIVANEGGSSGGHTAIRFGEQVFHFQAEDGLLVLRRERADDFLYDYTLLGNRTVHATRVAVSQDTYTRLVNRFRERHRAQTAQLETEAALGRDRSLLETLEAAHVDASPAEGSIPFAVAGLGYFARIGLHAGDDASPRERMPPRSGDARTLAALREAMRRRHGPDVLERRRQALREAMERLARTTPSAPLAPPPVSPYDHPPFVRATADRWRDLAAGLAALEVLEAGMPLDETAIHAPTEALFALDDAEIDELERRADRLAQRLAGLVVSKRSDWGQALLVGMARLTALDRSIATRRLVFLDTLPEEAESVGPIGHSRTDGIGAAMLHEIADRHARARAYLRTSGDERELAWERVEETANRYHELARALDADEPVRVARGHLVPSRTAPYPVPLRVLRRRPPAEEAVAHARRRERAYARGVRRLHRYGLLDQNCATAIFETINDSWGDSKALAEARLGGYVPSRGSLAFIPFVSARQVESRYTVVARETIPSYRRRRLAEMKQEESPLRVALRESNPFTSRTYVRNPADSFFVFFTDGTPLLRPILGAVNLTAALGQTTLGLLRAPFDRGDWLVGGLRGAFVSFVELGFANIRKGSNEWIPAAHRTLDPVSEPATDDR